MLHSFHRIAPKPPKLAEDFTFCLIAPCCWNMTVDQHESPAAKKVRLQAADLVKAGKTKSEILDYFVAQPQYGERILATPSQDTLLGKSAYWLTPIAFAFGAIIVFLSIRSLTKSRKAKGPPKTQPKASPAGPGSQLDERVEEELNRLDS